MPLTARIADTWVVAPLVAADQWVTIRALPRGAIRLAGCDHVAYPRVSRLGTRHFVHATDCGAHAPESVEHLHVKSIVARSAAGCGWSVRVEAPGPGWTADVLAESAAGRVAFEVQRSAQTARTYLQRQRRYAGSGVRSVWFVSAVPTGLPLGDVVPAFLVRDWEAVPQAVVSGRGVGLPLVVAALLEGRCRWRSAAACAEVSHWGMQQSLTCYWCSASVSVRRVIASTGRCRCGLPVVVPGPPRRSMSESRRLGGARRSVARCPSCGADLALRVTSVHPWREDGPGVGLPGPHWCLTGIAHPQQPDADA